MAITQNGSKNLIKSLFGYNFTAGAQSTNAAVVSGTNISALSVTLGSAQTWAVGTQVIVATGGATYVGLSTNSGTASTGPLTVDAWYTQGSTTTASSLSVTGGTVALVSQPLPSYYLGISTAPTSGFNSGTWTGAAFGQATESVFNEQTANGLGRAKATVAVTSVSTPTGASNTTSTITLTNTWNYTGTGGVTINSLGIFNAPYVSTRGSSVDTLAFCTQVASAPTVSTSGDQLVVTETISQS